jgi:glycerol kinase
MSAYVLAIDLGTSSAKAALISIHGQVSGWESEPLAVQLLAGGGAEQDPEACWRGIWSPRLGSRPSAARARARAPWPSTPRVAR